MPLQEQTSQLADHVFGRAIENNEERKLLRSGTASTSPQSMVEGKDVNLQPLPSGQTGGLSDEDIPTAKGAFELIKAKMAEVDAAKEKVFREQERLAIRRELLSNPALKALYDKHADLLGQVQERELTPDIKEGITNPVQAGQISLGQRADLVRAAASAADSLRLREDAVDSVLDSVTRQRKQDFDIAQQGFDNTRQYLQDILDVNADERADRLNDLQIQKIKSDLSGGVVSREKLLELGAEFGPEALGELNHALGLPPVAPFVQGVTGFGYENGENTYYGTAHKGLDMMVPENSPIQTSVPLKITQVFEDTGKISGGLTVYGVDAQGTTHKFLHLNKALVNVGDEIQPGEILALSGNTGTSTGPHVHWELTDKDGNNIDPRQYALPGQTSFVSRRQAEKNKQNAASEDGLRQEYTKQSSTFLEVQRSYSRIQASGKEPTAAGDLALIFSYMRILDPSSTVREGEFANAQNSAGILDQVRNMYNKALTGKRLADNQRKDFLGRAEQLYNAQKQIQNNTEAYYRNLATQRGLNPENVVPPYQQLLNPGVATAADDEFIQSLGF